MTHSLHCVISMLSTQCREPCGWEPRFFNKPQNTLVFCKTDSRRTVCANKIVSISLNTRFHQYITMEFFWTLLNRHIVYQCILLHTHTHPHIHTVIINLILSKSLTDGDVRCCIIHLLQRYTMSNITSRHTHFFFYIFAILFPVH